jgi:hypothetical protein
MHKVFAKLGTGARWELRRAPAGLGQADRVP